MTIYICIYVYIYIYIYIYTYTYIHGQRRPTDSMYIYICLHVQRVFVPWNGCLPGDEAQGVEEWTIGSRDETCFREAIRVGYRKTHGSPNRFQYNQLYLSWLFQNTGPTYWRLVMVILRPKSCIFLLGSTSFSPRGEVRLFQLKCNYMHIGPCKTVTDVRWRIAPPQMETKKNRKHFRKINQNSAFTLWLCQNSYWKWP